MSEAGRHAEAVRRAEAVKTILVHLANVNRDAETQAVNRRSIVAEARAFGATWQQIGDALGITRQIAHKRYATDGDNEP